MISKEDFEILINDLRNKLDETQRALVSDEFINVMSSYNTAYDESAIDKQSIAKLNQEKNDLLIANGKLFQKIGIEKEEIKTEKEEINTEKSSDEILEELINERGEII